MKAVKHYSVYSNVLKALKQEGHGSTEFMTCLPKQDCFNILHDLARKELSKIKGDVSLDACHKVACHVYGSL